MRLLRNAKRLLNIKTRTEHEMPAMMQTKVAIFQRSRLQRDAISQVLRDHGFHIIDGILPESVVGGTWKRDNLPNLIILDPFLLRENRALLRACCDTPAIVVIIAEQFNLHDLKVGFRAGIGGYILSNLEPEAIVLALRFALTGEKVFPSELASVIANKDILEPSEFDDMCETAPTESQILIHSDLTPRDVRILSYVAQGCSNKEIARALGTTEEVVKFLLRHIMRMISVRNRTQAALWAASAGIAPLVDKEKNRMPVVARDRQI